MSAPPPRSAPRGDHEEAEALSRDVAQAESELAAAIEAPDCDAACPIVERICGLSERICSLSERHLDDEELEGRCGRATASCTRAGDRVSAVCTCSSGE